MQRKKVLLGSIQDIDRNLNEEVYTQEIQDKIYQKKDMIFNEVQEKFKTLIAEIKRL